MALKGNIDRYGHLATALHWVAAIAVVALVPLGVAAAGTHDDAQKAMLLRLHVPLGGLTLLLTLVRILWWAFDRRPMDPPGQARWQSLTAYAVHRLMTLVTLVVGVSGVGLLVRSKAATVLFFGATAPLPDFTAFFQLAVHAAGAAALTVLAGFHVAAALYHQFYRRDRLFGRIGFGGRGDG